MTLLVSWAMAASWSVQLARMEGAATDVRQSALVVHQVANSSVESNRFQQPAKLFHATYELHKQVQSANLALSQLQTN